MRYKGGYKYQLYATEYFNTSLRPDGDVTTEFIQLTVEGKLKVGKNYAWDGPSGIAIDTKNFMRGSLAHDVLYQLMRMGLLPQSCRGQADRLLRDLCLEDGMWKIRAWWVYRAVRVGAGAAANPSNVKEVLEAP